MSLLTSIFGGSGNSTSASSTASSNADNRQALDTGSLGTAESSMAKVAVSEALMRIADRCVQVMGGMGVTDHTVVEQVFREVRAFRIYDGPTEVHKWSLAKKIKRDWKAEHGG